MGVCVLSEPSHADPFTQHKPKRREHFGSAELLPCAFVCLPHWLLLHFSQTTATYQKDCDKARTQLAAATKEIDTSLRDYCKE